MNLNNPIVQDSGHSSRNVYFCIFLESHSCDEANSCCGLVNGIDSPADDCCTDGNPCSVGEGGCQDDSNCKGDLLCGSENCDSSHGFGSSK